MRGLEQGQIIERRNGPEWERGTIDSVLKNGFVSVFWLRRGHATGHRKEQIIFSDRFRIPLQEARHV